MWMVKALVSFYLLMLIKKQLGLQSVVLADLVMGIRNARNEKSTKKN